MKAVYSNPLDIWSLDNENGCVCVFYRLNRRGDYKWYPNAEKNAKDIAHRYNMHDKLVATLKETLDLVCECVPNGFVDKGALEALFVNNGKITAAIAKAEGK